MEYFLAKNDHQLGVCLRMLLGMGYKDTIVESVMNSKHRMEFQIYLENVTAEEMQRLQESYQTMIS